MRPILDRLGLSHVEGILGSYGKWILRSAPFTCGVENHAQRRLCEPVREESRPHCANA